jgi:hypothetical protein
MAEGTDKPHPVRLALSVALFLVAGVSLFWAFLEFTELRGFADEPLQISRMSELEDVAEIECDGLPLEENDWERCFDRLTVSARIDHAAPALLVSVVALTAAAGLQLAEVGSRSQPERSS